MAWLQLAPRIAPNGVQSAARSTATRSYPVSWSSSSSHPLTFCVCLAVWVLSRPRPQCAPCSTIAKRSICSRRRRVRVATALHSSARQTAGSPPFNIVDIPGKGLGAVAARDIQQGEVVIFEAPLATTISDSKNLRPAQTDAIMKLHDAFAGEGPKTMDGVFRTNKLARGPGSTDGVVCDVISRFNHSCKPNCEQSWHEDAFKEAVHAVTNVAAGEELSLLYIDLMAPRDERMQTLLDGYGFVCSCPACAVVDPESDSRRARLAVIGNRIARMGYSPIRGLDMADEALRVVEEENIVAPTFRARVCFHAFQFSIWLGESCRARQWIDRAYQYGKLAKGARHPDTLRFCDLRQKSSEQHPDYGYRARKKKMNCAACHCPAYFRFG